jgi:oxygen-independent coproporphyrinogen-3 oxidase
MLSLRPVIDPDLLRKYGGPGPDHVTYPPPGEFDEPLASGTRERWLRERGRWHPRPVALYVQSLPDRPAPGAKAADGDTNDPAAGTYAALLRRELAIVHGCVGSRCVVRSVSMPVGERGTDADDAARLLGDVRARFALDPGCDVTARIELRARAEPLVATLAGSGFSRLRLAWYAPHDATKADGDRAAADILRAIDAARACRIASVGVELGCAARASRHLLPVWRRVIEGMPDRLRLGPFADAPREAGSAREDACALQAGALEALAASDYRQAGVDCFVRPDDPLAVAAGQGRLVLDCRGYSSVPRCDVVGLGTGALDQFATCYCQNAASAAAYRDALDRGVLPAARGIELKRDSLVRRTIIEALLCDFHVSTDAIGIAYLLDFDQYFARERAALAALVEDGLVEFQDEWIAITAPGRWLARHVARVFATRRER